MADNVNVTTMDAVPALEEIQNMKVTDLRKKLKAFGLPTAGNKTELIERLHEACLSNKGDSFDSSQLTFEEAQISEFDTTDEGNAAIEDSALLDQDEVSLYAGSTLEDESKILQNSENQLSSNPVAVPPKKRSFPLAATDGVVTGKKISINRTNVPTVLFDIKNKTEPKPETAISNESESQEKKVLSVKNMSAAERLAMRAKRFNTSSTVTTTNSTKVTSNKNSKQSIISSAVAPDLDILKKRAERFGQCVSTVMKQIEHKEKLLKRKCKFGASISATSSLDEQEKKRRRAERFGIS